MKNYKTWPNGSNQMKLFMHLQAIYSKCPQAEIES